jgi:hypothetical protein
MAKGVSKKKRLHKVRANRATGKRTAARAKAGQRSYSAKKGVSVSTVDVQKMERTAQSKRPMSRTQVAKRKAQHSVTMQALKAAGPTK